MKILLVQETDWLERYPHTQHHLMERLSLKGHSIKVIDYAFDWKKDEDEKIFQSKQEFHNVKKIYGGAVVDVIRPSALRISVLEYPYLMFSHNCEIKKQIKEFKPDIIIGFGILNAYVASGLAKKYNIPFIYYWIDALDTLIPEKTFQTLGRIIEQKTINNSRKYFVTNEKLKDHIIALGAEEDKIDIFSSGIDFNVFNDKIDGSAIRKKYGIKDNEIVLFFMGWIYHFSGLKEIAEELGKEKESGKYSNIKLLVVGEGDAYPDLQKLRDQYHLEDQLFLTGRQPYEKIPEYIASSDICILPAYTDEPTMKDIVPIKILEYMAMGKPVITTKLPGLIKEFGNDNGIIYANSPEETMITAQDILSKVNCHEYGVKARTFVEKYDWISISNQFEQTLKI
ncbi:glycosyltransferase family 4 protein [Methanoplanus endosymbiosus]|uniref:Glycosyltransferase family 4 protein n=1 Tax=Methanoplanus endosymbiosus TaxID=33865 RepID=A0A9E7TH45_9EURY|nr:glycosyltransferase family 4 protein [Methanoplanus endosymbiosus]UUX92232.1 glycosyltransferase family 4 protein [Methanoplanus endosymbiosus]